MFWFREKKGLYKYLRDSFILIKNSFEKVKVHTNDLSNRINDNNEKIAKLEGVISVLMNKEQTNEVREVVSQTPHTTPRTTRTPLRMKADRLLDKAELMNEINSMIVKGLSTTEMYNLIVDEKQLIKKTCFFKYLKLVRERSSQTTRTIKTN